MEERRNGGGAGARGRLLDKLMGDILTQMQSTIPPVMASDPGMKAIIGNFISDGMTRQRPIILKHLPAISEAMAIAYTREFSLAELKEIHAFALSPVGSHYFSKLSAIATDPAVSQANLNMMTEVRAATQAAMPAFKRKVLAYLIEHPELAEKIAATAKTAK